jgi:hypothetical protein
MKTTNPNLQKQFDEWVEMIRVAMALPDPSSQRSDAVLQFTRSFVPSDVTEDDIAHFSNNLLSDMEFFESVSRDLTQCASGQGVEAIEGNQRNKATFTILPPEGACTLCFVFLKLPICFIFTFPILLFI